MVEVGLSTCFMHQNVFHLISYSHMKALIVKIFRDSKLPTRVGEVRLHLVTCTFVRGSYHKLGYMAAVPP